MTVNVTDQICVWCWHHIMDMAEKDDTEGRCPACRTPYNKEKIAGTASKCERFVSISRTAAGAIHHFANNTCSVYITYSKEDEAVQSIQSVHGFVSEGRPLKACFGTTKYCHALRFDCSFGFAFLFHHLNEAK
ncbi:putative general negative regulator of transcription C16C9.04c [Helianthus annuus]|uniref:putative general negative regulator of transcription C16C9.04c n=1 Tax=Helianthus annuus TaxID=4232 RepID=UPI00165302A7|nr:putative general negative regulator of transcription C16C9.04c [Helianthus annuus]